MIPVRDAGKDPCLEIREDLFQGFADQWRSRGQRPSHVARREWRHDGIALGMLEVGRDPREEALAVQLELGGGEVAQGRKSHGQERGSIAT
jgi:hypothetical protein